MSDDPLEQLVLSGALFGANESDPEPSRSPSSSAAGSPLNTDDELGSDLSDDDQAAGPVGALPSGPPGGAGGGARTGPKGVIRDRNVHEATQRRARAKAMMETNRRMERMALSARTFEEDQRDEEDEAERQRRREEILERRERVNGGDEEKEQDDNNAEEAMAIAAHRARRLRELRGGGGSKEKAKDKLGLEKGVVGRGKWFGHLREVTARGYVKAIDDEDIRVPVVIHIYSTTVPFCHIIDRHLSLLARLNPHTKFLRVQASCIGFGGGSATRRTGGQYDEEDEVEEDEATRAARDAVLPTLLIYRGGQLEANLVRVDLELERNTEERAVRDLLLRYNAIGSQVDEDVVKATPFRFDNESGDEDEEDEEDN